MSENFKCLTRGERVCVSAQRCRAKFANASRLRHEDAYPTQNNKWYYTGYTFLLQIFITSRVIFASDVFEMWTFHEKLHQ